MAALSYSQALAIFGRFQNAIASMQYGSPEWLLFEQMMESAADTANLTLDQTDEQFLNALLTPLSEGGGGGGALIQFEPEEVQAELEKYLGFYPLSSEAVTRIVIPGETFSSEFSIFNMPNCTSIEFPDVVTIENPNALDYTPAIGIQRVALASGILFPNLETSEQGIDINVNPATLGIGDTALTEISFPKLRSAGALKFSFTQALTTVLKPALTTLTTAGTEGGLQYYEANGLEYIDAPVLAHIEGYLRATACDVLEEAIFPALTTLNGNIQMIDNPMLEVISFPALTTVPASGKTYEMGGNALTEDAVNTLLQQFASLGMTGNGIDISGGTSAAPSGAGITAKNALIAAGNTVGTN